MPRSKTAAAAPAALDSSCWLEYFSDSAHAKRYAELIENTAALIVPIVTIYEVYKVALREFGAAHANQAVALMREGDVIDVNLNIALSAAATGLPMADSLIYATAQMRGATLWTQDQHFEGLPGVKYFPKN
ncbi:MAG: type II toxin-antitoxin system VapC family toxin [Pseudomonadota bacterium]